MLSLREDRVLSPQGLDVDDEAVSDVTWGPAVEGLVHLVPGDALDGHAVDEDLVALDHEPPPRRAVWAVLASMRKIEYIIATGCSFPR
jgi:hypothetical protein